MIGRTLGHYCIVEKIGEGGMGVVYRAHDGRLDRDVAVKVLPTGTLTDEAARRRFHREARALGKLSHANIATVYDFDTQDSLDFIVTEYIPGVTLSDKLTSGPLPEKEITRLGRQLAEGLAAAHAQGVVHRDLKPGNLRVTPDGRLKILDFGLAKLLQPLGELDVTQSTTETHVMAGTLPYMPPERLQGEPADTRSDIYSLGAVLYEMATDQRPFTETHGPRLIDAILHGVPQPPSELNRCVSPALESIILKALDRDPDRRYQSAKELQVDLERLGASSEPSKPCAPAEQTQVPTLEIAHVLFIDMVAYSKLPMDEQQKVLRQLQKAVRSTNEFARAQANDELIRLPTGDGMALVFFGDPEAPVRCALEISRALRDHPEIRIRMGVHTGPVYRLADINANRNVAGGGINIAQRVMDCGDAGHILVSNAVADVLSQLSGWADCLHDLGEAEAKHGVRVHLFNLWRGDAGNPDLPQKLRAVVPLHAAKTAPGIGALATRVGFAAVCVIILIALVLSYRTLIKKSSEAPDTSAKSVTSRRSVAVLGFKNLARRPDTDWLSTALSEMLSMELAAGGQLRTIPGENVARMKLDLSLPDADSFAKDTLARIRKILGTDDVVLGSYLDMGKEFGGQVRLDLRLQDATAGETIAEVSETGTEAQLLDLVSRTGALLREKLGVGEVSQTDAAGIRASLPSNPEGARFYSEGLAKLRVFDALAARDLLEKAIAADPNYALAHSALAMAWSSLGYDRKAEDEAKKAFDLSTNLSREERLSVEGRYREATYEWNKAAEIYRTLWGFFPDNLDYGLRLARAQTAAGKGKDAMATVEALRKLPPPAKDDPQIDIVQAQAASSVGDFKRAQEIAARAAATGKAIEARLVVAGARLLEGRATAALGEPTKARAAYDEARQIYAAAGDRAGVAFALRGTGILLYDQGDLVGAKATYEEALAVFRELGNKFAVALVLNNIGNVLIQQGDWESAKKIHSEALGIRREIGNKSGIAQSLLNLGNILYREGDSAGAKKRYLESLAIAREIGDRSQLSFALHNLAGMLAEQGDLDGARKAYQQLLGMRREMGDQTGLAFALNNLGEVLHDQGDLAGARKSVREALAIRERLGEKGNVAQSQLSLASLAIDEGQPGEAETLARKAVEEFRSEHAADDEAQARVVLAESLLVQNQPGKAQEAIGGGIELTRKTQDPAARLAVDIVSARVHASLGKPAEAKTSLEAALAQAKKYGMVGYEFEARLALGEIEAKSDKPAAGRARLEALAKDATAKGFLLIARKARTAATSSK